jgi:hypothetical protein
VLSGGVQQGEVFSPFSYPFGAPSAPRRAVALSDGFWLLTDDNRLARVLCPRELRGVCRPEIVDPPHGTTVRDIAAIGHDTLVAVGRNGLLAIWANGRWKVLPKVGPDPNQDYVRLAIQGRSALVLGTRQIVRLGPGARTDVVSPLPAALATADYLTVMPNTTLVVATRNIVGYLLATNRWEAIRNCSWGGDITAILALANGSLMVASRDPVDFLRGGSVKVVPRIQAGNTIPRGACLALRLPRPVNINTLTRSGTDIVAHGDGFYIVGMDSAFKGIH